MKIYPSHDAFRIRQYLLDSSHAELIATPDELEELKVRREK